MPFTYTSPLPVATNFPSIDQPNMTANTQYLVDFGNKDHQFTQNSTNLNDGTHKQVTLSNQTTPGFLGKGANSVAYANTAGAVPQSQLFFNNAAGDVQLTSAAAAVGPNLAVPTLAANGVSFLPGTAALGGLLIQWGTDTKSTGGLTTFPVAFAAAAYTVVLTPTGAPGPASANGLLTVLAKTTTNFQIGNNTGNAQSYTYNWIAIGQAV